MPDKITFTEARLRALKAPDTGRDYIYDKTTPGFAICITATGSKTFYAIKWHAGQPKRAMLGGFPELSVLAARKMAIDAIHEIVNGRCPTGERRRLREAPTLGHLYAHWIAYAKTKKKTWKEDERQWNQYLKVWASRKLTDLRKSDIQQLNTRVATASGPYAANRLIALLRAMMNKAEDLGFNGKNPAAGIERFKEVKRDRFLHGDELKRFFIALDAEPNETLRDYFLTCLLCGARRQNVLGMRWADIDFDLRLWRIPDTKRGEPQVVPLTDPLLRLLRRRLEAADGSPWVFPGRYGKDHLKATNRFWQAILKRADISDLRPHDLRRSLGSWMTIAGSSLPITGKMLGHTKTETTAIYARLMIDPVRAAAEVGTSRMLEAAGSSLLETTMEPVKEGRENG